MGEDPNTFGLALFATNRAIAFGHVLDPEWVYRGHMLTNKCMRCQRVVYIVPASAEVAGPPVEEWCTGEESRAL